MFFANPNLIVCRSRCCRRCLVLNKIRCLTRKACHIDSDTSECNFVPGLVPHFHQILIQEAKIMTQLHERAEKLNVRML